MSNSHQAIGFANKFYTLWTIDTRPRYFTDHNGKHHLSGQDIIYTYHKNISFDIDKAKRLYPTLSVDESLRGKNSSWVYSNPKEDLCPNIMKFGKYFGHDILELVKTDFQYCMYIVTQGNYSSNKLYMLELPEIKAELERLENIEKTRIENRDRILDNIVQNGITFVSEKNLKIYDSISYLEQEVEGVHITFVFTKFSRQEYNGYSYGLPIIDGNAKRIKNKSLTIKGQKTLEEKHYVLNGILVNEITINK